MPQQEERSLRVRQHLQSLKASLCLLDPLLHGELVAEGCVPDGGTQELEVASSVGDHVGWEETEVNVFRPADQHKLTLGRLQDEPGSRGSGLQPLQSGGHVRSVARQDDVVQVGRQRSRGPAAACKHGCKARAKRRGPSRSPC